MSSAGVDREVTDTFRLVVRAGRQDCGVNNTDGDDNQGKTDKDNYVKKTWDIAAVGGVAQIKIQYPLVFLDGKQRCEELICLVGAPDTKDVISVTRSYRSIH